MTDLDAIADEEQAKARKRGPVCWVCTIPEREWVEKARKGGRTIPVIVATLRRLGHKEASKHRILHHMDNHVS